MFFSILFPVAVLSKTGVLYFTSVRFCASTTGSPSNCEVVIWPDSFGESKSFISFDSNVKFFSFEGEQCSILALPLLEVTLLVTVVEGNFTPDSFALCSQALFGCGNIKPVTGCPAHIKAAAKFFQQTKTCGLVAECEWGLCREKYKGLTYIACYILKSFIISYFVMYLISLFFRIIRLNSIIKFLQINYS